MLMASSCTGRITNITVLSKVECCLLVGVLINISKTDILMTVARIERISLAIGYLGVGGAGLFLMGQRYSGGIYGKHVYEETYCAILVDSCCGCRFVHNHVFDGQNWET